MAEYYKALEQFCAVVSARSALIPSRNSEY